MSLEITDCYELLALQRMVIEAKFHSDPDDPDIAGSPIAARVSGKLIQALQTAEEQRGRPERMDDWERWKKIDRKSRFWRNSVNFARRHRNWMSLPLDEKRTLAQILLAPFDVSDEDFSEFEKAASCVGDRS